MSRLMISGEKTVCRFDNLRSSMRQMHADLEISGKRAWYLAGSCDAVLGYESMRSGNAEVIPTFKGLHVHIDPDMEPGTIEFRRGFSVLGVIRNIS